MYSQGNRSAAIRIPITGSNPKAKRIEFRAPDASGNPYLAFAAMMMAGLDGIKNRIEPHEPVDKDLYELPADELKDIPRRRAASKRPWPRSRPTTTSSSKAACSPKSLVQAWIEYKHEEEIDLIRMRTTPQSSTCTSASDSRLSRTAARAPSLRRGPCASAVRSGLLTAQASVCGEPMKRLQCRADRSSASALLPDVSHYPALDRRTMQRADAHPWGRVLESQTSQHRDANSSLHEAQGGVVIIEPGHHIRCEAYRSARGPDDPAGRGLEDVVVDPQLLRQLVHGNDVPTLEVMTSKQGHIELLDAQGASEISGRCSEGASRLSWRTSMSGGWNGLLLTAASLRLISTTMPGEICRTAATTCGSHSFAAEENDDSVS